MKIIEIGTGYTPIPAKMGAATEIVVEELTRSFLKIGQEVEIVDIATDNRAENDLPISEVKVPKLFRKTDVSLGIMHKIKRVLYSIALAKYLKKLLKNTEEKLVLHFHNQYNLFFFLKLGSKKIRQKALIAYTNHSGFWSLPWEEVENTLKKRYFQEITAMKNADAVFVLNDRTRETVIERLEIPQERVFKINNGVNIDVYRPLEDFKIEQIKAELGFSGKKIILQVGSVNENKGQARAVAAFTPLLQANRDCVYVYAGGVISEAYQAEVQKVAKDNGIEEQVRYLGMIEPGAKLNEIYNIADIALLISEYEGFPLVCIESLACGTPVILSCKAMQTFGDGCIPCTFEDLKDVADSILSQEENKELSNLARQNAVDQFSWDRVAKDYLKMLCQNDANKRIENA